MIERNCIKLCRGLYIGGGVYTPCGCNIVVQWDEAIRIITVDTAETVFEFSLWDPTITIDSLSFASTEDLSLIHI